MDGAQLGLPNPTPGQGSIAPRRHRHDDPWVGARNGRPPLHIATGYASDAETAWLRIVENVIGPLAVMDADVRIRGPTLVESARSQVLRA
jgi:hypothetical protein